MFRKQFFWHFIRHQVCSGPAMATTTMQQVDLAPFPLLADPKQYCAGTFDYYQNCSR